MSCPTALFMPNCVNVWKNLFPTLTRCHLIVFKYQHFGVCFFRYASTSLIIERTILLANKHQTRTPKTMPTILNKWARKKCSATSNLSENSDVLTCSTRPFFTNAYAHCSKKAKTKNIRTCPTILNACVK